MDDVCYTIEALCSLPDSELNERIFNLGSEHSYTVFEIAQRVADRCEAIIGYRPKIDTYLNTQRISKYDDLSYRCSRLGAMKLTKSTDINYAIDSLLKFCVAHREVL
jgi:UDP-glucose 4-epimerase